MKKNHTLTKTLAMIGTTLIWLPLLAPILFSALRLFRGGRFLFDYLMPAEFFPVALVGGILLWWAAQRAGAYRRLIIGGLLTAVALLVAGQVLALLSGLASGEREPTGLLWGLVVASLLLYALLLLGIGVAGVLLLRELFRPAPVAPLHSG